MVGQSKSILRLALDSSLQWRGRSRQWSRSPRLGPPASAIEATAAIKAKWADAAIIVLTTYDTDEAIVAAVEAGANGYMLKDADPVDLINAVRRAAAGETVIAAPVPIWGRGESLCWARLHRS